MENVIREGVRLAYVQQGSGDRSIVFVHGWCCDHTYFAPQADYFAGAGYRTISVDLRGHGNSDKPRGEYPISQFADDVAYVIGELKLDRPVVVGHSMGGSTALQVAAAHPNCLRGLGMVDPAPIDWPDSTRKTMEEYIVAVERGDLSAFRSFIETALFMPTDDPEIKQRVSHEMSSTASHVIIAAGRGTIAFDGKPAAAACRVPVLHIAAEPPLNVHYDLTERFDQVVNAQTSGVGHFNQLVAPTQVNDMIHYFANRFIDWS